MGAGVKIEGNSGTGKVSREARELEAALEETKVLLVLVLNFQLMPSRFKCQLSFCEVVCIISEGLLMFA